MPASGGIDLLSATSSTMLLAARAMVDRVLRRLPDVELAVDEPLPRFLGALRELPVRFTPTAPWRALADRQ